MTEHDLKIILKGLDDALAVYRKNEGKLSALEIGLKSMLNVVRTQVLAELMKEKANVKHE